MFADNGSCTDVTQSVVLFFTDRSNEGWSGCQYRYGNRCSWAFPLFPCMTNSRRGNEPRSPSSIVTEIYKTGHTQFTECDETNTQLHVYEHLAPGSSHGSKGEVWYPTVP